MIQPIVKNGAEGSGARRCLDLTSTLQRAVLLCVHSEQPRFGDLHDVRGNGFAFYFELVWDALVRLEQVEWHLSGDVSDDGVLVAPASLPHFTCDTDADDVRIGKERIRMLCVPRHAQLWRFQPFKSLLVS